MTLITLEQFVSKVRIYPYDVVFEMEVENTYIINVQFLGHEMYDYIVEAHPKGYKLQITYRIYSDTLLDAFKKVQELQEKLLKIIEKRKQAQESWKNVPYPDEEEALEIVIEEINSLESDNWVKKLYAWCSFSQKDLECGSEKCDEAEIDQLKKEREKAKERLAELQKSGIQNNNK